MTVWKIKNPCNEFKMQNIHWNGSVSFPTAKIANNHVKPSKTERKNAIPIISLSNTLRSFRDASISTTTFTRSIATVGSRTEM